MQMLASSDGVRTGYGTGIIPERQHSGDARCFCFGYIKEH